jgi:hypothetical protein
MESRHSLSIVSVRWPTLHDKFPCANLPGGARQRLGSRHHCEARTRRGNPALLAPAAGLLLCPQSSNETSQLACRPKGRQLGSDDRAKVGTKPLDVGDQPLMRGFDRRSESSSGAVPVFGRASMLPSATKQSREFPLPWLRPRRCTMSGRMPDCRRPAAPCLEMGGELPHYSFLGCPTAWPRPERQRSRD